MERPEGTTCQVARLRRAAGGDTTAWAELIESHRGRPRRLVALRLDPRLRGRVAASDVIQEASLAAVRDLPNYLEEPALPFFLWPRALVGQVLALQYRVHPGVQACDAGREVRIHDGPMPGATSAALAAQFLGRDTRPSVAAARADREFRLQEALDALDPIDREVLALRHFEELAAEETARALGIEPSAAGHRLCLRPGVT